MWWIVFHTWDFIFSFTHNLCKSVCLIAGLWRLIIYLVYRKVCWASQKKYRILRINNTAMTSWWTVVSVHLSSQALPDPYQFFTPGWAGWITEVKHTHYSWLREKPSRYQEKGLWELSWKGEDKQKSKIIQKVDFLLFKKILDLS